MKIEQMLRERESVFSNLLIPQYLENFSLPLMLNELKNSLSAEY